MANNNACKENHTIVNGSSSYQKIFSDTCDGEIDIWARFYWKSDNKSLFKADFKLKNGIHANAKHKLHEVVYCKTTNKLEVRLSRHSTYSRRYYYEYDVDLTGAVLDSTNAVDFWIRSSDNETSCKKTKCATSASGDPDDKDGAIIIGS